MKMPHWASLLKNRLVVKLGNLVGDLKKLSFCRDILEKALGNRAISNKISEMVFYEVS